MPCCIDRMRFSPRFTIRKEKATALLFFFFFFFQVPGPVIGTRGRRPRRGNRACIYTPFFFSPRFDFAFFCDPWAGLRCSRFQARRSDALEAIKIFESNLGNQQTTTGCLNERWCTWLKNKGRTMSTAPLYKKKYIYIQKNKKLYAIFFKLGVVLSGSLLRSLGQPGVAQR